VTTSSTFYISAAIATVGTIGYHNLVKRIPETIDPMVSVIAIYIGVLLLGVVLLPMIYSGGRINESLKQLGWVHIGIAVCIVLMELGFILMYRSGWKLSVGNIVTGVAINIVLMIIGIFFLKEKLSMVNMLGVVFCIVGVAMVGFRSDTQEELENLGKDLLGDVHGAGVGASIDGKLISVPPAPAIPATSDAVAK
jgi:drug/metabolite transporter (DMT)-like permease